MATWYCAFLYLESSTRVPLEDREGTRAYTQFSTDSTCLCLLRSYLVPFPRNKLQWWGQPQAGCPGGSAVKNPLAMQALQEMWVRPLGWEDPLEKEMATYSSIPAWRIPWTEEPRGLQSVGLQRVRHDRACIHNTQPYATPNTYPVSFQQITECVGISEHPWNRYLNPHMCTQRQNQALITSLMHKSPAPKHNMPCTSIQCETKRTSINKAPLLKEEQRGPWGLLYHRPISVSSQFNPWLQPNKHVYCA